MELRELKELLKVLRDKGVTEYECDGIKLKLSDEVPMSKYKKRQEVEIEGDEEELSFEERMFWSAASAVPQENEPEAVNTES